MLAKIIFLLALMLFTGWVVKLTWGSFFLVWGIILLILWVACFAWIFERKEKE